MLDKVIGFAVTLAMDCLTKEIQPLAASNSAELESGFRETAEQMKRAVRESTDKVIDKLESDKLEILISRIGILGDIIRIGDRGEVLRFVWTLRELVDYAGFRLQEGKHQWQGPFLAGKAVIYTALRLCAVDGLSERNELERLCKQAKYDLLDVAIPQMIQQGVKIPWVQIEEFLSGCGELTINALGLDGGEKSASKRVLPPNAQVLVDVIIPHDAILEDMDSELTVNGVDGWTVGCIVPPNACLVGIQSEAEWRSYEVEAGVAGVLHSILVKKGDVVRRGDVVARVKMTD
jgi:hypothetical protein